MSLASRRQRLEDLCEVEPGLHREFQDSLGYMGSSRTA